MKKLLHGLIILSALVFLLLPAPVCAASEAVAKVGTETYTDIEAAWAAVCENGGTIEMLADWSLREPDHHLTVPKDIRVTLEMHGHVLDRGCNGDPGGQSDGHIFEVKSGASLTINGGNETTEHSCVVRADDRSGDSEILLYNGTGGTAHPVSGALITGSGDSGGAAAICLDNGSALSMEKVTLAGNYSYSSDTKAHGAVIQAYSAQITLTGCTICYNYTMGYGTAFYIEGRNTALTLNDTTVSNNAAYRDGGAIYVDNENVAIVLKNSSLSRNRSAVDGGAIFSNDNELNITLEEGSFISKNTAGGDGGAICYANSVDIDAALTMKDGCDISENRAGDDGGAIYVGGEGLTIEGGAINNNTASSDDGLGGGIYFYNDRCTVTGTSFTKNSACKGGAIYLDEMNCTVKDCEIYGNTAGLYGGAIYVEEDENTLSGVSIYENHAGSSGGGVYMCLDLTLSAAIDIHGNTAGTEDALNNLYLPEDHDGIYGTPADGSFIGISAAYDSDEDSVLLTAGDGEHQVNAYYSDSAEQHIETGEDGQLYLKKGIPTYTVTCHVLEETSQETVNSRLPETLSTPENEYAAYFLGWYYDSACTKQANGGDPVNRNVDLYAKYKSYTLYYWVSTDNQNVWPTVVIGDTLPEELWSLEGTSIYKLISLNNHVFRGWYYDDVSFKNEAHGGDAVTGDVNLYPRFSRRFRTEDEDSAIGSALGEYSVVILLACIVLLLGGAAVVTVLVKKRKKTK